MDGIPVAVSCRVLKFARAPYYQSDMAGDSANNVFVVSVTPMGRVPSSDTAFWLMKLVRWGFRRLTGPLAIVSGRWHYFRHCENPQETLKETRTPGQ